MLKKLLVSLTLFSVLLFTGCTTVVKEYIYVEADCPQIKILKTVDKIDGNVTGGCVCDTQLSSLLKGASMLRKSETYYINELTKYNTEFIKPAIDNN